MNKTERLKLDKIRLIKEIIESEKRRKKHKEYNSILGHLLEQVPLVLNEEEIEMRKGMSLEI